MDTISKKPTQFLIRNDDVSADTTLEEIQTFCQICDKYGYQIIQGIFLIGEAKLIKSAKMTNDQIIASSDKPFSQNKAVLDFLRDRHDLIAVHGLWHTHQPSPGEISVAKLALENLGFKPQFFIPPFNEGSYPNQVEGLITSQLSADKGERLEDFLDQGTPQAKVMYLHSWRFDNNQYTFDKFDECLKRLT